MLGIIAVHHSNNAMHKRNQDICHMLVTCPNVQCDYVKHHCWHAIQYSQICVIGTAMLGQILLHHFTLLYSTLTSDAGSILLRMFCQFFNSVEFELLPLVYPHQGICLGSRFSQCYGMLLAFS